MARIDLLETIFAKYILIEASIDHVYTLHSVVITIGCLFPLKRKRLRANKVAMFKFDHYRHIFCNKMCAATKRINWSGFNCPTAKWVVAVYCVHSIWRFTSNICIVLAYIQGSSAFGSTTINNGWHEEKRSLIFDDFKLNIYFPVCK